MRYMIIKYKILIFCSFFKFIYYYYYFVYTFKLWGFCKGGYQGETGNLCRGIRHLSSEMRKSSCALWIMNLRMANSHM
jgi:hypothetical protein